MIQITPQEQFPIIRKLDNPNDAGTYYVRAVVRNSITGAIIQTVNLTDQGSGRFTSNITAPNDTSGTGLYIDITTRVYSDSAYTTPNEVYSDENAQYVVAMRWGMQFGGGGGGSDIDYKKVRAIFEEELSKYLKLRLAKILKAINDGVISIKLDLKTLADKEPEETEVVDLSPVLIQLETLQNAIEDVHHYVPDKVSIASLSDSLRMIKEDIALGSDREIEDQMLGKLTGDVNELRSFVELAGGDVNKLLSGLAGKLDVIDENTKKPTPEPAESPKNRSERLLGIPVTDERVKNLMT